VQLRQIGFGRILCIASTSTLAKVGGQPMRTPPATATLRQIFYVSNSLALPEEIESILKGARAANARRHITGVLVHAGAYFAQLLEGEKASVEGAMRDIVADRRHDQVRILMDRGASVRMCEGWHMAFLDSPGPEVLMDDLHSRSEVPPERIDNVLRILVRQIGAAPSPNPTGQFQTIEPRNS
jgi:hypothetical protein